MGLKWLILLIIFTINFKAFAKTEVLELKGIDIFKSKEKSHLNPGHGIAFVESGLLENIAEIIIETKDFKEPDYLKDARKLIDTLFHKKPSGFVPSDAANKVSGYLHPGLIGILLKLIIDYDQSKEDWQKKLKEKIIETILKDNKVKDKIAFNRDQYCNFDSEIKKIENDLKNRDIKKTPEIDNQLAKLRSSRAFNKVFKKIDYHKCHEEEIYNFDYKKNDLTKINP